MNIEKGCKCCSFNLDSIKMKSNEKTNIQKLGPSSTTVPISNDTNIFIRGLSWGGTKWNWSQGSTNKLKYYFGTAATSANCPAGVTALNGGAITTENWTDDEKSAMRVGLKKWTDIIGMETEEVFNVEDTDLRFYVTEDSSVGYYGAQFGPHSQPHQGTGIYRRFSGNTWTDSLQPGGFGFITIIHELGHAMGLAHPHDSGGGSINFPGVSNSGDKGDNNLNQNTFTVMSYIDINSGINPTSAQSYGFCKGPMAFDIATMKFLYGLNPNYETGNNIYTITEGKVGGIDGYACIYDTLGEDMIIYNGTKKVTIDLRPATITNQIGGGGFISKVDDTDIFSGYTIANGGIIEKATGGSNDDTIYQPESVENILDGRNGVDKVVYKMNFSDYIITDLSSNNDGSYITVTKDNVTDTLYNIEKIEFSNGIIDTNNIEDPQDYSLYSSDIQSPGLTINADNATVFNEITITTNESTITNLDVVLDEITHTWVGDLKITLTNMNTGTSLILLNKAGDTTYGSSGNDFIGTVFSDSGTVSIDSITPDQNPYTGIYYPHDNENRTYLNVFNGEEINSTWRLTIEDTYPSLDNGLFVKWSLRFKPKETDIVDQPEITGPIEISIYENSNFVHTYTSNESVTWSIIGGDDSSLFEINPSNGYLNFKNMVNYDSPSDTDSNNIYNVTIRATNSSNNFRDLTVNVTILNLDDITLSSNKFTKVNALNSNYVISAEDGTGRIQHYWNSNRISPNKYLKSNEPAFKLDIGVVTNPYYKIRYANNGIAGNNIDWEDHFVIKKNGNIGIGTTNPDSKLYIYAGILGQNTDDEKVLENLTCRNGNLSQLKFSNMRNTNGGDWTSASTRIQQIIDVTKQGYLEFNPLGNMHGIALGQGDQQRLTIATNGNIGIGTINPNSKLDINAGILGQNIDDEKVLESLICRNSNLSQLKFSIIRNTNGGDWTSASTRIQQIIDVSKHGYLEFDPPGNIHGIALGQGDQQRLTIATNGNIGIGTINPKSKLDINAGILGENTNDEKVLENLICKNNNLSQLKFSSIRNTNGGNWTSASTRIQQITDVTKQGYIEFNSPGNMHGIALGQGNEQKLTMARNGNIGIKNSNPQSELHVNGIVTAVNYINLSDKSKKEEIKDMKLGLNFIKTLKPVSYKFKGSKETSMGLIAQDVESSLNKFNINKDDTTIVKKDQDDKYSLSYIELISPLIKSVQELSKQNEELNLENKKLINRIEKLESKK